MMNKFKTLMAIGLMALGLNQSAQAGLITIEANGMKSSTNFEGFDIGKTGDNVSDQFNGSGINFDTWGKSGINLTTNATCNNASRGMTNQYLLMGMSTQCSTDSKKVSMVSIMFTDNISEMSWLGFNRAIGKGYTIQALYDDMIVAELNFNSANNFENQYVNISGSIFNELRFMENGNSEGYFGVDNMAWNVAPAEVPLPGSVALLGIGLLGLSFVRKKSNKV